MPKAKRRPTTVLQKLIVAWLIPPFVGAGLVIILVVLRLLVPGLVDGQARIYDGRAPLYGKQRASLQFDALTTGMRVCIETTTDPAATTDACGESFVRSHPNFVGMAVDTSVLPESILAVRPGTQSGITEAQAQSALHDATSNSSPIIGSRIDYLIDALGHVEGGLHGLTYIVELWLFPLYGCLTVVLIIAVIVHSRRSKSASMAVKP